VSARLAGTMDCTDTSFTPCTFACRLRPNDRTQCWKGSTQPSRTRNAMVNGTSLAPAVVAPPLRMLSL
jgi:hypothetical protein